MSVTTVIRGIPVEFPFKPYGIQVDYMDRVIECLENDTTAVLESPTGTGKTLSLLCSSLAWLQQKKLQVQTQRTGAVDTLKLINSSDMAGLLKDPSSAEGQNLHLDMNEVQVTGRELLGLPTIIYASRTHSQLTQAVQELKKSAYNHMQCSVLGSRDQLCIHPEVLDEPDRQLRLHMCQLKIASRACHYNNRVEARKKDPEICDTPILDIEDMVNLGKKRTFCPYYMTKERKQNADIIFTPYNYLLDPLSRKSLGLRLANSVIILDEGHNIEKVCEDSASVEIRSTDLALAIEETAAIMKMVSEGGGLLMDFEQQKDLDPERLTTFKFMLHEFEKVLHEVPLNSKMNEVTSFPGDYIYSLLEQAQITSGNISAIAGLIDQMIQYLAAQNEGPFARKGKGLQHFADFLSVVFVPFASKEKIKHSYKVHIKEEEDRKPKKLKTWLDKDHESEKRQRVLSFWCFNPGFGMNSLSNQGVRSLIITSGTLAPLRPLISELGLDVRVRLENPHVVGDNQICVRILTKGPDGTALNSSYQNRENPMYISSLGRAIVNLSRIVPQGLLIFFPSYPIMLKCRTAWEAEDIWATISAQKAIFVEPKEKEAFNAAMAGYYEKIRDPNLKGAVFMGVCRGKVSEGLDFADAFGRAVVITGLPYPPLKDPRVILKRRYLDVCHSQDKEYLNGQGWYSLEASRAVNQAIGRVIRHRHDYGAIMLLDERFNSPLIKEQMSKWLRNHIKVTHKFGELVRDMSQFFRKAQADLPAPNMKYSEPPKATFNTPKTYSTNNFNSAPCSSRSLDQSAVSSESGYNDVMLNNYVGVSSVDNPNGIVSIYKRDASERLVNNNKRKKICLVARPEPKENFDPKVSMLDYVNTVRTQLGKEVFSQFSVLLKNYGAKQDIEDFIHGVDRLIPQGLKYLLIGMDSFIRKPHQATFRQFLQRNNLAIPENL